MQDKKDQIKLLANMVEEANKRQQELKHGAFGKCEWTDLNGEDRCNSPWSEFQCDLSIFVGHGGGARLRGVSLAAAGALAFDS